MNRKQFQQWLEQFPEDAIIEVGIQSAPEPFQSYGEVVFEEFIGEFGDDYQLIDFRDNQFVKERDKHYNKVYLQLGE